MSVKKIRKYQRISEQIKSLFKATDDPIARMATISAILYHKMPDFSWVGFYLLKRGRLIVGPYQGPLACQELQKDRGVCWAAVKKKSAIIVPDVNKFPDHIACSEKTKSEIVIPVKNLNNRITGVLDIDSELYDNFDETDAVELAKIAEIMNMKQKAFMH
jgi:L-methionine (R)-S-oxide reductase